LVAALPALLALSSPAFPAEAQVKPAVALMTALPLVWGEGGAFDPKSRPSAMYTTLQREFDVRPIDALDEKSLAGQRIILLIQPRWLAPAELVALDTWVRRGGRALILTDPNLGWPTNLPLGDIRRPPPSGLLKPLLDHWGLATEPGPDGPVRTAFGTGGHIQLDSPGRLVTQSASCRLLADYLATCSIGAGKAFVLADADMVRDDLWRTGAAPGGEGRPSDNAAAIADLLDMLGDSRRERRVDQIAAREAVRARQRAMLWFAGALGVLTLVGGATALLRRRRGKPHTYPQG
jgi:hypothetical protein